jgi:hypothetical protein
VRTTARRRSNCAVASGGRRAHSRYFLDSIDLAEDRERFSASVELGIPSASGTRRRPKKRVKSRRSVPRRGPAVACSADARWRCVDTAALDRYAPRGAGLAEFRSSSTILEMRRIDVTPSPTRRAPRIGGIMEHRAGRVVPATARASPPFKLRGNHIATIGLRRIARALTSSG